MGQTLFDKIWNSHVAQELPDGSSLILLDRIFLHERTGAIALSSLRERGRAIKSPSQVFATMDHIVDTRPGRGDETTVPGGRQYIETMRAESTLAGVTLFDINDPRHGISHLIAAEQAIALPGLILACPDSHTCTLGGLGTMGWGIGTSDCEHALATQTLRASKPKQMQVRFDGRLANGVTAKDMIVHLIAQFGASGAKGYAVEFAGSAVSELPIEARFTLCNMAVEFSAFTGLIAPDEKTTEYLQGRPFAPTDANWSNAISQWQQLRSDADAQFDQVLQINAAEIAPTITWGTSPEHAVPVTNTVPDPSRIADPVRRESAKSALQYMGLQAGQYLSGLPINGAFIGSCTNSRMSDLRMAADILRGHRVAAGVRAICTPGSMTVKHQAEQAGLDRIFREAGFEWREPGCSLCFYAGGEGFNNGDRVITSTNRNFRSRQGPGVRSHLASPASVAAAAVAGAIVDVRDFSQPQWRERLA